MDHVAIMRRSGGLISKILSGKKTIESRWYVSKRAPWGKIAIDDNVYFKDSSVPVSAVAKVKKVISFTHLNPEKINRIVEAYGQEIGVDKVAGPTWAASLKDKKYCLLIFLENPHKIIPFNINKAGFGLMSAWLVVDDIKTIACPIEPVSAVK